MKPLFIKHTNKIVYHRKACDETRELKMKLIKLFKGEKSYYKNDNGL